MFTNKAQASRLTPIFSAGSSKFCLSVVCIWRKSKSKRLQKHNKIPLLVWAAQRGPFISSATHTKCIFLSFSVSIFHFLYLKHKSHNIIYAIGYVSLYVTVYVCRDWLFIKERDLWILKRMTLKRRRYQHTRSSLWRLLLWREELRIPAA